ncbi:unnamed protein product, partial [Oikopleura dioica]
FHLSKPQFGNIQQTNGSISVPQIFFNEKHIGGRDEFQKLDEKALQDLIKNVQENEPPENAPSIPGTSRLLSVGEDEGEGALRCEYDTDADIAKALKDSNLPKKRWNWLQRHHGAFTGNQLKEWLDGTGEDGKTAATRLLAGNFITPIEKKVHAFFADGTLYQLVEQKSIASLNAGVVAECKVLHPSELGEQMRIQIKKLYGKYLNDDGTSVDYDGLADSEEFGEYVKITAQLQRVDLSQLSVDGRLAFFINIYNALIIHGQVIRGIPQAFLTRLRFFWTTSYIIGGHVFTLDDIENGVLRGNRKGPAHLCRQFSRSDPRLKFALPTTEPKIHFALVCGAKSCPPIKCFSENDVQEELKIATEGFIEDDSNVHVNIEKKKVKLSMIFKWYQVDFGDKDRAMLIWIFENMNSGAKSDNLKALIEQDNFSVSYFEYDWTSNSKSES